MNEQTQETPLVTLGMLHLARAIHAAGLTWRDAATRMHVTGGHLGRILKGRHAGAETREGATLAFGVHASLWGIPATAVERDEWARLIAEMKSRREQAS